MKAISKWIKFLFYKPPTAKLIIMQSNKPWWLDTIDMEIEREMDEIERKLREAMTLWKL